jgi:arsenate reductase-like glutaredoxin family protein
MINKKMDYKKHDYKMSTIRTRELKKTIQSTNREISTVLKN